MTLTEFLLARIAEDEAVARDVAAERVRVGDLIGYPAEGEDHSLWADYDGAGPSVSVGADRVLAECKVKRKMVELFGYAESFSTASRVGWYPATVAIRSLALPYVNHPDWREEWRP